MSELNRKIGEATARTNRIGAPQPSGQNWDSILDDLENYIRTRFDETKRLINSDDKKKQIEAIYNRNMELISKIRDLIMKVVENEKLRDETLANVDGENNTRRDEILATDVVDVEAAPPAAAPAAGGRVTRKNKIKRTMRKRGIFRRKTARKKNKRKSYRRKMRR